MNAWFRPLPCEGVICAILGAALGVVLSHDGVLPSNWPEFFAAIGLLGTAVLFGIGIHFTCTAAIRQSGVGFAFFLLATIFIGILFNLSRVHDLSLGADGRLTILPDTASMKISAIFMAWLSCQLALSLVFSMVSSEARDVLDH